jgi:hypothetical protein
LIGFPGAKTKHMTHIIHSEVEEVKLMFFNDGITYVASFGTNYNHCVYCVTALNKQISGQRVLTSHKVFYYAEYVSKGRKGYYSAAPSEKIEQARLGKILDHACLNAVQSH